MVWSDLYPWVLVLSQWHSSAEKTHWNSAIQHLANVQDEIPLCNQEEHVREWKSDVTDLKLKDKYTVVRRPRAHTRPKAHPQTLENLNFFSFFI